MQINEENLDNEGNLDNEHAYGEDSLNVDASIVDEVRGQKEEDVLENEPSDEEDETRWQYVSDNEGPTIPDDDDDGREDD